MRRRDFIALAGCAAAAPTFSASGQQVRLPVIGYLSSISEQPHTLAAFRRGLSEQGYVEGRDVAIEYRYAQGRYDRLTAFANELISHPVDVIVAFPSSPAALAAKAATASIPIVFYLGADPVELGLVSSYNRPGGNVTGISEMVASLTPKRLELLDGFLPKSLPLALLVNPTNKLVEAESKPAEETARTLGRQLILVGAGTESEIDAAFETLTQKGAGGLAVWAEAFFAARRSQIAKLAERHRIATIYPNRLSIEAGGLMSYGSNPLELFRQLGIYAGKILRGTSPADLPVLQPTTFELVINMKKAKELGIDIPSTLLDRADEVIE